MALGFLKGVAKEEESGFFDLEERFLGVSVDGTGAGLAARISDNLKVNLSFGVVLMEVAVVVAAESLELSAGVSAGISVGGGLTFSPSMSQGSDQSRVFI